MIVDFTVENFKSIKHEQVLSMTAVESLKDHKSNFFQANFEKNINLLKTNMIFGGNASGKSNILNSILYLQQFILNSTDLKLTQKIPYYEPFYLDTAYADKTVKFEIEFILNDIRYQYILHFSATKVVLENLYFFPNKKQTVLFERENGKIKYGASLKGYKKNMERELLENVLFLSKAANSNLEQLKEIYLYFLNTIKIETRSNPFRNSFNTDNIRNNVFKLLNNPDNPEFKKTFIDFLKNADFGINDMEFVVNELNKNYHSIGSKTNKSDEPAHKYKPIFYHKRFNHGKEIDSVAFDLTLESTGTIKMMELAAIVIDALENGKVLIIDELDASLHPSMTKYLIKLFHNDNSNKKNAQLIFSTHDTSLLREDLFRKDQVWFTEKDKTGATHLFSLCEFEHKEVSKSKSLQNWYLNGRFGGIPILNNIE